MKTTSIQSKTVLITGCSSGIGLAAAKMLRNHGWRVAPTARKPDDLNRLRSEGFDPVQLEMTDSESIASAARLVKERFNGQLGALVNNAGFGLTAAIEDAPRAMFRDLFEVNVFGMQELTNLFIPLFRNQGYGRIVNISSVLGEISLPFAGIYSASKYAVEAISDALRRELFDSGISVSIIQPGPIETEFSKNLAHKTDRFARNPNSVFYSFYKEAIETRKTGTATRTAAGFMKPPEAVAEKILSCLEKRHPPRRTRVTAIAHFGAFAGNFLPDAWLDTIMTHQLRRVLRQQSSTPLKHKKDG